MAAEMVSSAVIGETVNRIVSSMIGKLEDKSADESRDNVERLEMAHIRMEAALAMSSRWQITDVPMLRWRSKLKRAAQECDDALFRCKQQRAAVEDEEIRSHASFPKRIAHATKSLISSFISSSSSSNSDYASTGASVNVQRFERFADGANEFLKLVEFGGTPRQHLFFNPLIGHLLSGKSLRYQSLQGSTFYYLGIKPMSFEERGVEAMVWFVCQDSKAPTEGVNLGFMLRLSESTDVFGVIINCLQSCMPHFKQFAAERVNKELIQLPTQDFSRVTPHTCGQSEYWMNVHNTLTQWYRPNPLCCSDHEHPLITSASSSSSSSSTTTTTTRLCSMFPEQVIMLLLQFHISLSDHQQNSDVPPLKLGALFIPHDSPEDMEPATESYALEVIGENEQQMLHTNACLQDIDDKLLPKALQYLYDQNNGSCKMYQMCFKSRHGTAHLCVEKKTSRETRTARTRRSTARSRGQDNKRIARQGDNNYSIQRWKPICRDLLKFWVVRASDNLQGSIRSWAGSDITRRR